MESCCFGLRKKLCWIIMELLKDCESAEYLTLRSLDMLLDAHSAFIGLYEVVPFLRLILIVCYSLEYSVASLFLLLSPNLVTQPLFFSFDNSLKPCLSHVNLSV